MERKENINQTEGGNMINTIEKIERLPITTGEILTIGTGIYYTGDMANMEGTGRITKLYSDRWGAWMTIKLEDGRTFQSISPSSFSGPGGRFITVAKWRADREEKINAMMGRK